MHLYPDLHAAGIGRTGDLRPGCCKQHEFPSRWIVLEIRKAGCHASGVVKRNDFCHDAQPPERSGIDRIAACRVRRVPIEIEVKVKPVAGYGSVNLCCTACSCHSILLLLCCWYYCVAIHCTCEIVALLRCRTFNRLRRNILAGMPRNCRATWNLRQRVVPLADRRHTRWHNPRRCGTWLHSAHRGRHLLAYVLRIGKEVRLQRLGKLLELLCQRILRENPQWNVPLLEWALLRRAALLQYLQIAL